MGNHRKEERKKIMSFTPVYDLDKNTLLGYIGDLTLQGALVIGEKPVEVKEQTAFAIDFPETPDFPARRMKILARVAWSRHESDAQYYDTGIEFQDLSEQNKEMLEAILARYQYRRT